MKLSLLFTLIVAGTASAFQPSAKQPLANNKAGLSPDVRAPPLTKADMVAIRSPFWNAFSSPAPSTQAKYDFVVDRDYTVALTLLCVGMGLTMFHPSECGPGGWSISCVSKKLGVRQLIYILCYTTPFLHFYFYDQVIPSSLTTSEQPFTYGSDLLSVCRQ